MQNSSGYSPVAGHAVRFAVFLENLKVLLEHCEERFAFPEDLRWLHFLTGLMPGRSDEVPGAIECGAWSDRRRRCFKPWVATIQDPLIASSSPL
jgi:hypothetical protein